MGQKFRSTSSSKGGSNIEFVDYEGKKEHFTCGHKARETVVVRFFDQKKTHKFTLPFDKDCAVCRMAEFQKIEACSDCRNPRLDGFNIEHICSKSDKPVIAANTKA